MHEHKGAYNSVWTDEAVAFLREKAKERWSADRISAALQQRGIAVTRSSVAGKAIRENIALTCNVWPDEATTILHSMAGSLAGEIAARLSTAGFFFTARNVSDKARRDGIRLRLAHAQPKTLTSTARQRLKEQRIVAAEAWAGIEFDPVPASKPVTLLDLKSHHCRWPLCRDGHGDRLFCGAFTLEGPYCEAHHHISIEERKPIYAAQEARI